MELINFLEHTDHRNLKFVIAYKVKERQRELAEYLEWKRCCLRQLLAFENLKYDEELVLLIRERIEENARKQEEWFGEKRIERQLQEEQFLKFKKLQREFENCEKMRHLHSKQILIETKQVQLYQIEERKALREKEQRVEQMWLQVMQRLNEEKGKQEMYGQKLCAVIARSNQAKNLKQQERQEAEKKANTVALQKEFAEDDKRAIWVDKQYREMETNVEARKKLNLREALQNQIGENRLRREFQRQCDLGAELDFNEQSHKEALKEITTKMQQNDEYASWQHHYMEHVRNESKSKLKRDQQLDNLYLGLGSVVQQQTKTPYNKATR